MKKFLLVFIVFFPLNSFAQDCEDSDSGLDVWQAGRITYADVVLSDECLSDGVTLRERHCKNSNVNKRAVDVPCTYGCVAGRCLRKSVFGEDGCYVRLKFEESWSVRGRVSLKLLSAETKVDRLHHMVSWSKDGEPFVLRSQDDKLRSIGEYGMSSNTVHLECGHDESGQPHSNIEIQDSAITTAWIPYNRRLKKLQVKHKKQFFSFDLEEFNLRCVDPCEIEPSLRSGRFVCN